MKKEIPYTSEEMKCLSFVFQKINEQLVNTSNSEKFITINVDTEVWQQFVKILIKRKEFEFLSLFKKIN
jgi:hypothetical protein